VSILILSSKSEPHVPVTVLSLEEAVPSPPSDSRAQGESPQAPSGQLSVVEVSTLDRLPGTHGETHSPKNGKAFLVVEARLQNRQGPAELSSEQAQLVSASGRVLQAIGAGEKEFCIECTFGVSSEGETVLSFVFLIENDQVDETFSFRYEGFPEILISASGGVRYP
jgi:hypothetical protein